jgi:hypothetical protein
MGNETNSYFDPIRWEFELPSGVPTFGATFAIP